MSDNDPEFEDFENDASPPNDYDAAQMEEEEDDLVCASSPAHAEGDEDDEDDEDDYDAPEEDAEEEAAAPSDPASATSWAPAAQITPAADYEDDRDLKEAYVMRSNAAYLVPLCRQHDGPGRVRDFGDAIVVEDDNILGAMHLAKNWPLPESFPPTAVCVLKAKHTAEDELLPVKNQGPFAWYARVVTKQDVGMTPRKSANKMILKHIPRKVVLSLIKYLSLHSHFRTSSLIKRYKPAYGNSKAFRVDINGWVKCPGIKSTGVAHKREAKDTASPAKKGEFVAVASDDEDLENNTESAEPREKGSTRGASKPAPAPSSAASAKKKPAAAPAPVPEPVKKNASVATKGVMLSYAKPTNPVAETAPAPAPARAPAPAPEPEPAATVEEKAAAPQDKPTRPPAAKSSNEGSSGSSSGQKRPLPADDSATAAQNVALKRVRTLVVKDAEKSVTFWKGNTLYIAEL